MPHQSRYSVFFCLAAILIGSIGCSDQPKTPLEQAQDDYLNQRYEDALARSASMLKTTTDEQALVILYNLRGRCYLGLADLDRLPGQASPLDSVMEGSSADPQASAPSPHLLAAIEEFTKSIEVKDNKDARYLRSGAYLRAGDQDRWIEDGRIARGMDEDYRTAYQVEPQSETLDLTSDSPPGESITESMKAQGESRGRPPQDLSELGELDPLKHLEQADAAARSATDPAPALPSFPSGESGSATAQDTGQPTSPTPAPAEVPEARPSEDSVADTTDTDDEESSEPERPSVVRPRIPPSTWQPVPRPSMLTPNLTPGRPWDPVSPSAPWSASERSSVPTTGLVGAPLAGIPASGLPSANRLGQAPPPGSSTLPTGVVAPARPTPSPVPASPFGFAPYGTSGIPSGRDWTPNLSAMPRLPYTGALPERLRSGDWQPPGSSLPPSGYPGLQLPGNTQLPEPPPSVTPKPQYSPHYSTGPLSDPVIRQRPNVTPRSE